MHTKVFLTVVGNIGRDSSGGRLLGGLLTLGWRRIWLGPSEEVVECSLEVPVGCAKLGVV